MQQRIKIRAIETFLFTKADPGILGTTYELKPVIKVQNKNIKNKGSNSSLSKNAQDRAAKEKALKNLYEESSPKETSPINRSSISHLCQLTMPTPPLLKPPEIIHDLGPPLHYFYPSQEVMQIMIRKAYYTNNMNELDNQMDSAYQNAEKEFDLLE
jgi:hypothetical protein